MAANDFLGVGWEFPITLDPTGEIKTASHEQDISESIRIILATANGERVMRPTFGCGIHEMVFAVISMATIGQVEVLVTEALTTWEPRIEIDAVKASTEEAHEGRLLVEIKYRVRATNTPFNLVYPFYLKEQS
jgi:uncharacterized protein